MVCVGGNQVKVRNSAAEASLVATVAETRDKCANLNLLPKQEAPWEAREGTPCSRGFGS